MNRNVGILSSAFDPGLILIPASEGDPSVCEIDTNEAGLKQTTLMFALLSGNTAAEPRRGLACSEFVSDDDNTRSVLDALPYLACQTSKRFPNGQGDGVDRIEVVVMGAIFDPELELTPPYFSCGCVKDTQEVLLFTDSVPVKKVSIDYRAVELNFEYVSEHFLQDPQFIQYNYQLIDGLIAI